MDHSAAPPDLDALARDWITLWQSELAAIAVDREAQESWQAILALWAGIAGAMLNAAPRGPAHERADRHAGAAAPAGAAAAPAAPDARDVEIERLTRHVAELELRLAEVERDVRRGGGGHRRGTQGSEPRRQRR